MSAGNRVNNSSKPSMAARYGNTPLTHCSNGNFDTPVITFSTLPTGGVIRPIEQFRMNNTPK
ncbi:MAG: hypothetical protein ACD_23C00552G0004 [uncultured bacterium]|nr:MAG: hypothetical protein ACD_23C00552G0004 [uncultured bacterium]